MKPLYRDVLRAAGEIRKRLAEAQDQQRLAGLPEPAWLDLKESMRRIERARRQGLHAAARRLRSQLICQAEHLQDQVIYLVAELRKQAAPQNLPSVSELYRDILALEHEFEEVGVDFGHHEVFVTTEPVELEGIYLGPFQIRLNWNALVAWPAYSIVALEPNPAASNEDVTHPHVQDGCLCEGEGRSAIRGALSQGRLYDFFLLVWQVLSTYGQGNAYVELDRWNGTPCCDCGSSIIPETGSCCGVCGDNVCDDCGNFCCGCDRDFCSQCISACEFCNTSRCSSCLSSCEDCDKPACPSCLKENLCEDCHEKRKQRQQDQESDNEAADPGGDLCPQGEPGEETGALAAAACPGAAV